MATLSTADLDRATAWWRAYDLPLRARGFEAEAAEMAARAEAAAASRRALAEPASKWWPSGRY
jgi:hypothetical protein